MSACSYSTCSCFVEILQLSTVIFAAHLCSQIAGWCLKTGDLTVNYKVKPLLVSGLVAVGFFVSWSTNYQTRHYFYQKSPQDLHSSYSPVSSKPFRITPWHQTSTRVLYKLGPVRSGGRAAALYLLPLNVFPVAAVLSESHQWPKFGKAC